MTDNELVKKSKQGDTNAFEQLVKKYEGQVAATVIGMLGKTQAADDVGQEVFIRFYKYLGNFREDASLGTYLTRIAINLSLNEIKRRKRRQLFFSNSEQGLENKQHPVHPDDLIYRNENQKMVYDAIQKLDPNFRAVIVLRLLDGYSTEETAKILDVPTGTVLSRLSRAQKKLKAILAPYIEEEI